MFRHRPTGYNTNPNHDRTVYYDRFEIARVIKYHNSERWHFFAHWAEIDGIVDAPSLDVALLLVKALFLTQGHIDIHGKWTAPPEWTAPSGPSNQGAKTSVSTG